MMMFNEKIVVRFRILNGPINLREIISSDLSALLLFVFFVLVFQVNCKILLYIVFILNIPVML